MTERVVLDFDRRFFGRGQRERIELGQAFGQHDDTKFLVLGLFAKPHQLNDAIDEWFELEDRVRFHLAGGLILDLFRRQIGFVEVFNADDSARFAGHRGSVGEPSSTAAH